MATPSVLPPSFLVQEPALLCQLILFLNESPLNPHDRLTLVGVLQHAPAIANSPLRRITSLNTQQLKLLAEILLGGLIDARSWGGGGGRRKSAPNSASTRSTSCDATPTPSEQSTAALTPQDSAIRSLFESLDVAPFPTQPVTPPPPPLPRATSATTADAATSSRTRSAKLAHDCCKRQEDACPLTLMDQMIETGHIIPHSVARLSSSAHRFWFLAAIILGPIRDTFHNIVHGANSYAPTNGLAMEPTLHRQFDKGIVVLVPQLAHDESYTQTTRSSYNVVYRWRAEITMMYRLRVTLLDRTPERQIAVTPDGTITRRVAAGMRQIEDGDAFTLWTNDPRKYPLPHPLLLSVHEMLWRMVDAVGLGTTAALKKRRAVSLEHGGESDGESDDGGIHPLKKRVNHGPKTAKTPPATSQNPGDGNSNNASRQTGAAPVDSDMSRSVSGEGESGSPITSFVSPVTVPGTAVGKKYPFTYLQEQYLEFRLRGVVAERES